MNNNKSNQAVSCLEHSDNIERSGLLRRRLRHASQGYTIVLVVFLIVIGLGLYLFNLTLTSHNFDQRLITTVHDLRVSSQRVSSRMVYLKELLTSRGVSEILVVQVRQDLSVHLEELEKELERLIMLEQSATDQLWKGKTNLADYLYAEDVGLESFTRRLLLRSRKILEFSPSTSSEMFSLWAAIDTAYSPAGMVMQQFDKLTLELHNDLEQTLADWNSVRYILYAIGALAILAQGILVFRPLLLNLRGSIRETLATKEKLYKLANHDLSTGYMNSSAFISALNQYAAQNTLNNQQFALFYFRINNIDEIESRFGADAVSVLWQQLKERIEQIYQHSELKAKISDSDFVIVIEDEPEISVLESTAEGMLASYNARVLFGETELDQQVSMCIHPFTLVQSDPRQLLSNADLALKESVSEIGNRPVIYDPEVRRRFDTVSGLKLEIKQGINEGQFEVWYQPKINLQTGKLSGMEALLRWQHPTRGLLMPGSFLEVAEKSLTYMWPLTRQIITSVTAQHRQWSEDGFSPPPIAINLPQRIFLSEEAIDDITEQLLIANEQTERLAVEVTEKISLEENRDMVFLKLQLLYRYGIKIALDDFGTGYASLSNLLDVGYNEIKIDRDFVEACTEDAKSRAIIENTIKIAATLKKTVTAEGVETIEQHELLRRLGCDTGQGFLFAPAMSAEKASEYMKLRQGQHLKLVKGMNKS